MKWNRITRLPLVFVTLSFLSVKTNVTCAINQKKMTVSREVKKKLDDSVKTHQHSFLTLLSSVLCDMQVGLDIFVFLCWSLKKNFFLW